MSEIWLFYNRVNELLKPMLGLKFDINYRSVFAFEEWINQDKLSIAYRLNHYIHYTFLSTNTEEFKDTFLGQCLLVFRLMKEKNLFENIYRRLLIDRITQDYAHYDIEREKTLV